MGDLVGAGTLEVGVTAVEVGEEGLGVVVVVVTDETIEMDLVVRRVETDSPGQAALIGLMARRIVSQDVTDLC